MNKSKVVAILIVVVIALMMACNMLISAAQPVKTTGTIPMVEPCGWFFCGDYDQQYAEKVNLPNSEANVNNSEARVNDAQAEQVQKQTVQYQMNTGLIVFCGTAFIVGGGLGLVILSIVARNRR